MSGLILRNSIFRESLRLAFTPYGIPSWAIAMLGISYVRLISNHSFWSYYHHSSCQFWLDKLFYRITRLGRKEGLRPFRYDPHPYELLQIIREYKYALRTSYYFGNGTLSELLRLQIKYKRTVFLSRNPKTLILSILPKILFYFQAAISHLWFHHYQSVMKWFPQVVSYASVVCAGLASAVISTSSQGTGLQTLHQFSNFTWIENMVNITWKSSLC